MSALFFSQQQDRKTGAQKTYFFNMLRLAAFLQLFLLWQADKAGFMWHNNKKYVSTFQASAQNLDYSYRLSTAILTRRHANKTKKQMSV